MTVPLFSALAGVLGVCSPAMQALHALGEFSLLVVESNCLHAFDLLSEDERGQHNEWLSERLNAPDKSSTEWGTRQKARHAISEIGQTASYDPTALDEIDRFLKDRYEV